ncbi:cytochrome P450 oxidoreductase [Cucurbitaria berberidis CBS 394.84]|uniref:Cytochrome P450 oxidoreductase n=1 Tax=Cucurbitaria berberidis CBS 394.84 TaxID=1168544 RepID=A0A9P4GRY8_9PLEO|nr:cytochrome P450 oxidoreductase [Cucurbitaria berberidis CBS 394.84]KAF1851628.1 cytochrome P450 oxidoreductase [Cucurbitaria berberidis CBS 394.84]
MAVIELFNPLLDLFKQYWVAIIGLATLLYLLSNRYQKGLQKIPGPWIRSVSSIPRILSVYKSFSHEDDLRLHKKYGKIVRIAPNSLSISDPHEINTLYGISTKFYKSRFYDLASVHDEEGLVPDPFVLTNKELHSRMKRNAANAYSMNGLLQMESWIEPVTERLLQRLEERHVKTGQPCDLGKLLQLYAMDAVFSLTFGKDKDFMEHGDQHGMMRTLDLMTDYMAIFGQIPWIHKFLLGNKYGTRLLLGQDTSEEAIMKLAMSEVDAVREKDDDSGPCTFLRRLLLNQKSNPASLTDREIFTHSFGNIAAGSDTTAIALRSVMIHLLQYPDVQAKLHAEIQSANLQLPVSFVAANSLPYLNAVIKEAMRLHPSVGLMLARYVPQGGATICGQYIAQGTEVGINPWVLHRDPQVYPQPDIFRPERWLEAEKEHLSLMNKSFLTFGAGAHTCSGRQISLMEVTKVIPTLLLTYDFKLVEDGRDISFKNRWFTPQKGLKVFITKAKNEVSFR